jgi:hypothetical protein
MQVSPPQTQRQLVSGKVGWGWRQATYPISLNFGLTGFVMLVGAIYQFLTHINIAALDLTANVSLKITALKLLVPLLLSTGCILGIFITKNIILVCQQNREYRFSQWQILAIALYWLILIVGLSTLPNFDNLTKSFVALWWILPASVFTSIAANLLWRSLHARAEARKNKRLQLAADPANIDTLNIVVYSDQTLLVSPLALGQQPKQFNGLVFLVFGFFLWTMLDFAPSIKAIASMILAIVGLTGFFTWQIQLRPLSKILCLRFSGIWGMAAEYAIDLRPFSSLAISKLQEAGGELSWMQLTGSNQEITMPLTMTMISSGSNYDHGQALGKLSNPNTNKSPNSIKSVEKVANEALNNPSHQLNDQLEQVIRQEFHLAKQESERDSLGMANVLLPQGAGILAGIAFMCIGCLILFLFPLPSGMGINTIAWLAVCMISPAIARCLFKAIAPNSLPSSGDYAHQHSGFGIQPWEIGAALLLICVAASVPNTTQFMTSSSANQLLLLLTLVSGWLGVSISICILAFVRRTPLSHVD